MPRLPFLSAVSASAALLFSAGGVLFVPQQQAEALDAPPVPTLGGRVRRQVHPAGGVATVGVFAGEPLPSTVNCTWKFFDNALDHFTPGTTANGSATYRQRYCIYDSFWKQAMQAREQASRFSASASETAETAPPPPPIFFYTGNESPVEEYVNNTGLMWSLGKTMGALIVFAEHRYEGESVPDLVGMRDCMAFCTSSQALADFAVLVNFLKADINAPEGTAVVAFGGSYGGMLSSWFRLKYPHIVDGAIAASAPIWGLPKTYPNFDGAFRYITNAASAAGGATDQCRDHVAAAYPIIDALTHTVAGRKLLGSALRLCEEPASTDDAAALINYWQDPWFYLAEGDYPFPSTYITFSVGPGLIPLPAWPIRKGCAMGLDNVTGVTFEGNRSDVRYNVTVSSITGSPFKIGVDWNETTILSGSSDWTLQELEETGLSDLLAGLREVMGMWHNLTGDLTCYDFRGDAGRTSSSTIEPKSPPANVLRRSQIGALPGDEVCTSTVSSRTASWDPVCCNENVRMVNTEVKGVGNDMFWPPSVERGWTYSQQVESFGTVGCRAQYDARGLFGLPDTADPWSTWLDDYYGGIDLRYASNIVFSNGALDPWTSGGVLRNFSDSVFYVLLDEGAHHLDLFFETPEDPPCAKIARDAEEKAIRSWVAGAATEARFVRGHDEL